ncbi:MAG: ABC transporter permease [Thermoanaerobaculia bacterium]
MTGRPGSRHASEAAPRGVGGSLEDSLYTALSNLSCQKLRAALTMLGIVFGVGAVISMLSIGAGAEQQALATISRLGLNNVLVRAREIRDDELEEVRTKSPGVSLRDVEAIRDAVPGVVLVAPKAEIEPYGVLSIDGTTEAEVFGVSELHDELVNLEIADGRFLDPLDVRRHGQVAVIGDQVRRDLFGYQPAVGRHLKVNDLWLEVVGVLGSGAGGESDSFEGVQLGSSDSAVYVPVTTALRKFDRRQKSSPLAEIIVQVEASESGQTTARLIDDLLDHLHAGQADYELVVPEALLAESRRTQRMFNIVMGCIAGISLLVGGIGIMNIMLASVLERTREIGVRRAVGARRQDILFQFIVESFSLAAIGGLAGIFMGIVISKLVAASAGWTTIIQPWSVLLATGVAVSVGVASGVYPAIRAADLDPIDALRWE